MADSSEKELLEVFRREAEELINQAERSLSALEGDPGNRTARNDYFRALHSLKGNAAVVGLHSVEEAVHKLESVLETVRDGSRIPSRTLVDRLFALLYTIKDASLRSEPAPDSSAIESLESLVMECDAPQKVMHRYRISVQYPGEAVDSTLDPAFVIQDIAELGRIISIAIDPNSILPLSRYDNADKLTLRYFVELESARTIDEVRTGFFVFDDVLKVTAEPLAAPAAGGGPISGDTSQEGSGLEQIKVNAAVIEDLLDLAGEMSTASLRLTRLIDNGAPHADIGHVAKEIDSFVSQLQDGLLGARMLAIDNLFRPVQRTVRELSSLLGKQTRLITIGNDVELDKIIIEQMRSPLTHIIRNSIDHGIEKSGDRLAAGKPEEGRIIIKAEHREGSIYLDISDDGRGIDRDRVRQKAIASGLLAEDSEPDPEQLDRLIFESGLTTADRVTNVSGRGVGMDVVRRTIEQLRGEIRISNRPGSGVTFTIRLPLTLALLDGVIVKVREQRFVVPIISIDEAVFAAAGTLTRMAGQGAFVVVRGEPVPVLRLGYSFAESGPDSPEESSGICVLIRFEGKRCALLVDDIDAQQQFVIKSLESNFTRVEGFTGATIAGDGRVALIADVPAIIRMSTRRDYQAGISQPPDREGYSGWIH